jgi:uncharacterized protein (TIGR00297 family)
MPAILLAFHRFCLVALVTILFALLARAVRGVNTSGAIAGGAVCLVLYTCAGPGAFVVLAVLFIITLGATRLGYQRKQRLGTAERKEGRTASQVLANIGIAAICASAYRCYGTSVFLAALCASLAEAAADTVSSEVGQMSSHNAWLITTWKKVPAGVNGGISIAGTLAGAGAALLVVLAGLFTRLITRPQLLACLSAAFIGMVCDSYLGATLEWRGFLNNNSVNFLGTLTAVLVAVILHLIF